MYCFSEYEVECACSNQDSCPVARFNKRFHPPPPPPLPVVSENCDEKKETKFRPANKLRRRQKSGKLRSSSASVEDADFEWQDWDQAQGRRTKDTRSRVKPNRKSSPVHKASSVCPEEVSLSTLDILMVLFC